MFALVAQGCMRRLGAGTRAVAGPDSVTVQLYVLQRTLCVLSKCCAQAPWPTGTTAQWYDDNTRQNCRYEVSTHRVDFLDHGAFFWTAARQRRPHLHNFHSASTTTAIVFRLLHSSLSFCCRIVAHDLRSSRSSSLSCNCA